MRRALIDTPADLESVAARMMRAPEVALDVEGDGLFRYRARLCSVQLATPAEVAIVDTLALADLEPLAGLAAADGPVKVVHDASFDVRLLAQRGVRLERLFDTSIAARFLGDPATGLASLVAAHFGVTLDKEQQQADWGRRPLDERALGYLEADVRHLLDLAALMRQRIVEAGIEEEVAEECAYLLWKAEHEEPDRRPPWMRIKRWEELSPVARYVLREVAQVRERNARQLDVPPFKVVGNAALLALARDRPRSVADASRIHGLGRGRARRILTPLVQAVREGEGSSEAFERELREAQQPGPGREEREAARRRHRTLSRWRQAVAEERGLDVQLVLPGHCLQELARRGATELGALRSIPGIGDFRVNRDGEALLRVLR